MPYFGIKNGPNATRYLNRSIFIAQIDSICYAEETLSKYSVSKLVPAKLGTENLGRIGSRYDRRELFVEKKH